MRNLFLFSILALVWSNISAQKINYSSDKKYQKIRLAVKSPMLVKKVDNKDADNVAFVQMPFLNTKKVTYGSLISVTK